ncbi:hypothetical protein BegalDRAFT_1589 [Beggiatoa alba B18LD]|uniref:Uncharacterized protein n=1 Tax=Beggiatoa alba B18LD TaxID=395493 RepID=I3CFS5_9GAMM|nr:hypothetical protein [Beggiatoa alba]EIJ42468.1 hypothetical protein BegalDRAFT_1589 [Beggiatoa alba B18LD]
MTALLHASPSPTMHQTTHNSLQIATVGMDKQARHLLELVFKGPGRGQYTLVDDLNLAEAGIFDKDCLNADNVWKEYRQQTPLLPTIIVALQQPATLDKACCFVKKPIEVDKLLTALAQLKQLSLSLPKTTATNFAPIVATQKEYDVRLASTLALEQEEEQLHILCGHSKDIDPNDPESQQRAYYNPQDYLQGFFEKAFLQTQQHESPAMLLQGFAEPILMLANESIILFGQNFTESKLRTMTLMPLSNTTRLKITPIAQEELKKLISHQHFNRQSIESFLWKITLWTARGRLPTGTDLQKAVSLTHWPNFTRLELTPHAMEIAALWTSRAYPLLTTAQLLNIRQRYVFAFYSAATTLKLTTQEKLQESIRDEQEQSYEKRGLFQRVLSHLRGKF